MLRIAKLSSLILGALLLVTVAKAEHHEGKGHVAVHGAVDVFWSNASYGDQTGGALNASSLDHNDVGIGLATLNFAGSVKNIDYYLEFAYGDQAGLTAASDTTSTEGLSQAYITHHFNDQVSFTAGRMATNVGFESAFAKDNWNYTRSISFLNAQPRFHDGVAVKYNHNSGFGAGLFLYDGNNDGQNDTTESGSSSIQLSYAKDKWAAVLNYYTDGDYTLQGSNPASNLKANITNFNFTYDFNSRFSAALSYLMGEIDEDNNDAEWTTMALYAKYMVSKKTYAALRYETYEQESFANIGTNADEEITGITLTYGMYCDGGSEFRLEYSQISADNDIFVDDEGTAEDAQSNVSLAWINTF